MSIGNEFDAFRDKFRLETLCIHVNPYWILSVRPEQLTLGSMVVSSKNGARHFNELGPQEGAALTEILSLSEHTAKGVFGAVRINVVCLMMQDPIVHFHVLPRYEAEIRRYEQIWKDEDWPGPPAFRKVETSDAVLVQVTDELREAARRG